MATCARVGAPLYGHLPGGGTGEAVEAPTLGDMEGKRAKCHESNEQLFQKLFEDKNAEALHELTLKDYEMGRMSKPMRVSWSIASQAGPVDCSSPDVAMHVLLTVVCVRYVSYPGLLWSRERRSEQSTI